MKKQIRLNAFAMNCVAHQSPGLWTHPRDRTLDYNRLPYWLDLAKTLERGRFDGLFLATCSASTTCSATVRTRRCATPRRRRPTSPDADSRDGGGHAKSRLRRHQQSLLRAALSVLPRRMTTLDHLTEGRIG